MHETITPFSGFSPGLRKELHADFPGEVQPIDFIEIAADDELPPSGMDKEVCRNAERDRLSVALSVGYARTRRWVGADMFDAAAAHYILAQPPDGWTPDDCGEAFPEVLAGLFADDAEVAELAWMEWHLQQACVAPDSGELTPEALAAAGLGDAEWEQLVLNPASGIASRPVTCDLAALWQALADTRPEGFEPFPVEETMLLIWRSNFQPHYRLVQNDEFAALALLLDGTSFGAVAEQIGEDALPRLGQWFARWLQDGLFGTIAR